MEHVTKFVPINFVEISSLSKKLFEKASTSFVDRFSRTIGFLFSSCSKVSVES